MPGDPTFPRIGDSSIASPRTKPSTAELIAANVDAPRGDRFIPVIKSEIHSLESYSAKVILIATWVQLSRVLCMGNCIGK